MNPDVLKAKRELLARYQRLNDFASVLAITQSAKHGTCRDFAEGRAQVAIRHDMDSDFENALKLARWENAHAIRSTYFVLHTDWYYPGAEVTEALDEIASLGHEIGLHNNCVAQGLRTQEDPRAILATELARLRERYDVVGTAAHGDSICHANNVTNNDILNADGTLPELGLTYEAYHLGHALYLSDNGGKWDPQGILEGITQGKTCVVLMHPIHWAIPCLGQ